MPDLTALLNGNRKAQREFYGRHKVSMFKLCRMYIKNKHTAEDVLQEGFVKIFRALDSYDSSKGQLETWMRAIFTNTCLMQIRSEKRISETVELTNVISDLQFSFDEKKLSTLSLTEIYAMLHDLPDGYRMVFVLFFVEGLNHKEISNLLGISTNTSKTQLFKSKKKMQELIIKKFPNQYTEYAKTAQ